MRGSSTLRRPRVRQGGEARDLRADGTLYADGKHFEEDNQMIDKHSSSSPRRPCTRHPRRRRRPHAKHIRHTGTHTHSTHTDTHRHTHTQTHTHTPIANKSTGGGERVGPCELNSAAWSRRRVGWRAGVARTRAAARSPARTSAISSRRCTASRRFTDVVGAHAQRDGDAQGVAVLRSLRASKTQPSMNLDESEDIGPLLAAQSQPKKLRCGAARRLR